MSDDERNRLTRIFGDALARVLEHGFLGLPGPAQAVVAKVIEERPERIRITVSLEPYGVMVWLVGDDDKLVNLFSVAGERPKITIN